VLPEKPSEAVKKAKKNDQKAAAKNQPAEKRR
jgi:hypothetical protein